MPAGVSASACQGECRWLAQDAAWCLSPDHAAALEPTLRALCYHAAGAALAAGAGSTGVALLLACAAGEQLASVACSVLAGSRPFWDGAATVRADVCEASFGTASPGLVQLSALLFAASCLCGRPLAASVASAVVLAWCAAAFACAGLHFPSQAAASCAAGAVLGRLAVAAVDARTAAPTDDAVAYGAAFAGSGVLLGLSGVVVVSAVGPGNSAWAMLHAWRACRGPGLGGWDTLHLTSFYAGVLRPAAVVTGVGLAVAVRAHRIPPPLPPAGRCCGSPVVVVGAGRPRRRTEGLQRLATVVVAACAWAWAAEWVVVEGVGAHADWSFEVRHGWAAVLAYLPLGFAWVEASPAVGAAAPVVVEKRMQGATGTRSTRVLC